MEVGVRHEFALGLMLRHAMTDTLLWVLDLLSWRDYVAEFAGGLDVWLEFVCDDKFGLVS